MFTKPVRLIGLGIALLLVGILASLQGVMPVHAASPAQTSTPACNTCHENQYYLHDVGKWYCITEAKDRCVNCHGGNAEALTEEEAHVGLVANPFSAGAARCQECHVEDTEARLEKVASYTGYQEAIPLEPYVPHASTSDTSSVLPSSLDEPVASLWFIPAGVAVFLLWLFLVIRSGRS
jgi:nitrate/TMAO reductase-like tetraheme cytochrome c subunit